MSKKILILTASPMRDKIVDELLAAELRALGNEVWVAPCLREGRVKTLEILPDIVILPPIRNVYSRDFAKQLKTWGVAVVTRHTEPSCDKADYEAMTEPEKMQILSPVRYLVDTELVWGPEEAEILNKRPTEFKAVSVGSFSADKYLSQEAMAGCIDRGQLCEKHHLDPDKKTILILSAWGFIDSAPDLQIDSIDDVSRDEAGRKIWLEMIERVKGAFPDHNILVTLHPNVDPRPYREFLKPLGIPLDTELRAMELVRGCDLVIHAGSTTAIGAHILGIPALQYGDQNVKEGEWWSRAASPISHVSPHVSDLLELLDLINKVEFGKSNADPEALAQLEKGRYGPMDGQATKRAAEIIDKLEGSFKYTWPDSGVDYSQITYVKDPAKVLTEHFCNVCQHKYAIVNDSWLKHLQTYLQLDKEIKPPYGDYCPWCGTRLIRR